MVVLRRIEIKKFSDRPCYVIPYKGYQAVISKEGNEWRLELYEADKEQEDAMNLVHDEHFKTLKEAIFVAGLLMSK